eukprot:9473552-Pyramimonas_sp.AAC.1
MEAFSEPAVLDEVGRHVEISRDQTFTSIHLCCRPNLPQDVKISVRQPLGVMHVHRGEQDGLVKPSREMNQTRNGPTWDQFRPLREVVKA